MLVTETLKQIKNASLQNTVNTKMPQQTHTCSKNTLTNLNMLATETGKQIKHVG